MSVCDSGVIVIVGLDEMRADEADTSVLGPIRNI